MEEVNAQCNSSILNQNAVEPLEMEGGDNVGNNNEANENSSSSSSCGSNGVDDGSCRINEGVRLRTLPLVMIIFYNVSGGPFGIEESVRSAGFFFSILGFIIMPLVWSVPEAMITAELGSAFPEASGGVAWVEEAFGHAAGFFAGYLGWIAGATDNAIYPVLFLDYVYEMLSSTSDDVHPILRFVLLSSTSILLGFLNWLGLEVVGTMSVVIGFLSLSPFICMILIGASKVDPKRWFQLPNIPYADDENVHANDDISFDIGAIWTAMVSGAVLWRPLLNNLFWNFNSFDSTGSFAGEVENPGRTLPRAMIYAILLIIAGYLFPLMIAVGATDSTQEDWVDGYLATAAIDIGGGWLGAWVIFAAGVANIALFQAELSADAFQLMGMAERGFLPKIFATRSRFGTPTYGIMVGIAVIVAMGSFNLDKLIEMLNFNYAISLLLEYAAFIKLRISKPDLIRPFRFGLGTVGCIAFLVPPIAGILLVMTLASYTTILFGVAVNVFGLFLYYSHKCSIFESLLRFCRAPNTPAVEYEVIGTNSVATGDDLPPIT